MPPVALHWLSIGLQVLAAGTALYLARRPTRRLAFGGIAAALVVLAGLRAWQPALWDSAAGGEPAEASAWAVLGASTLLVLSLLLVVRTPERNTCGDVEGPAGDRHNEGRRAESWFKGVLEAAADAIVIVNADGTIVLVNPQTENLFGYAGHELLGRPVELLLPERARAAHVGQRQSYVQNPVVRAMGGNMELYGRRKDGSEVPLEISLGPVRDESGLQVVAAVRDISARKAAEAQLRESERTLSKLMGHLPGMAFRCRGLPDRKMDFVSPGCLSLTGYSVSDLTGDAGLPYLNVIDPADRESVRQALATAIQEHAPVSMSYRIRTVGGGQKWVMERSTAHYGPGGEFIALEGLVTDVTSQKVAEQAIRRTHAELERRIQQRTAELSAVNRRLESEILERERADSARRESEHRLAAILDNATAVIYVKDREGRYQLINRQFEEVFGVKREEILSLTDESVFPPEFADLFRSHDQEVLRKRTPVQFEERAPHADGMHTYLSLKFPLGDGPEPHAVCGISTDITDRIVVARELSAAKEAADAANRAKSEFLATMSHELRTPLNGLIGMMELLMRTELDVKQRRYAWMAKSSGDTLLALINDILDFSKVEAGKLDLEEIDFDLHYTVENVAVSLASRAENAGLELICGIHPSVPRMVRGDPGRLQQILINLVTNAIKFTNEGQVVIRVTVDRREDDHTLIRFTVNDSGIGIPAKRKDRLFQSFSQVDSSTTRKYGGTGLGLAICKRLTELMDGEIGVESEEGRGSTFWFVIPMKVEATGSPREHEALTDMRNLHVLCVDDNAVNRELICTHLQNWNISHDAAEDGAAALERMVAADAAGRRFDVVLVDMQMPEMDGFAFAGRVRDKRHLEDTVLILLTSLLPQADDEEISSQGFAGWLPKPVRSSQLLATLVEAVTCARAGVVRPEEAADHVRRLLADTGRKGRSRGARILVADDDEISREIAKVLLQEAGYNCHAVTNGQEAREAIRRDRFALVLMDCQMPEMDGFEATRRIREDEAASGRSATPIVALTANAMQGDRERCLAAGMNDYLSKPLEPNRLIDVVETNLQAEMDADRPADTAPRTPVQPVRGDPGPSAPPVYRGQGPRDDADATTAAPIDVPSMLARWENNVDLISSVLRRFRDQTPGSVAQLAEHLAEDRFEDAARIAHTLKGTAAYISAQHLRTTAGELERLAHETDRAKSEECLLRLRAELRRCLEFLPSAFETLDAKTSA